MAKQLDEVFPGDSEMARIMRSHDWSETALGDPSEWPDALVIPLRMLLTSKFEMWLGWGSDLEFFYNDAYIPTLGIKHPRMLGRPFKEVWSEVYDDVVNQVDSVRQGEATWNSALLLLLERRGYPEETYHSFSYSPLYGGHGRVEGLLCVVTEETERVIGERRLETLRELGLALTGAADLPALHDALHAAFATNRRDFPFVAFNLAEEASDVFIFERIGKSIAVAADPAGHIIDLPPGEWPKGDWDRPPTRAIAIAIPGPREEIRGTMLLALNPYLAEPSGVLDFARLAAVQASGALANIDALNSERRRADRIWTLSRDLMVIVDEGGTFRSVSPSWTRILGHSIDEVIGRPFAEFMHPADIAPSNDALARALGSEQLNNYENRFRGSDGLYRSIEWHTTLEDGLVYAYGRDVTERREVEQALSSSEEQFRHLVQGVTDYAIYMLDLEGHVSSWNEGARRIKGYEPEEIIGQHFSRFYTQEDREREEPIRALETARREGRFLAEGWRLRKSGERFRASVVIDAIRDDSGRPIGFAKITRDITEREEAQNQLEKARETLAQSQKMEAIGQLTGGVAHDFNNLLTAILGSLELLQRRLPDDPRAHRLIDNAIEGARRGATLTQRLLAFARRQELTVDAIDLPLLLSGMNDLVQSSIGPEWPISTHFPLKLPLVRADANQLEMAILNLIVNARDASPSGGSIQISATSEAVGQGAIINVAPGGYVRLVVKDQGSGMDTETLRRATEPFFTTKGVGKGTGLGLPMVHGTVEQIGGTFELLSNPGEGTSAVLWLPVSEGRAPSADLRAMTEQAEAAHAPTARVLAVDDDALVLMNTVALLEDLGHEVYDTTSAADALAIFRERGDIDLVVTDQAMPKMTGTDLIAAIDEIRPGTPAIIASGYGEGVTVQGRAVIRLPKPFTQGQLADAVAQAIETEKA